MDDVKRKVYLDLFAAPSTLLPLVGGVTVLLGSWALGGNELLTFGGIAGIMSGVGIFATRLIYGLEKITEDAFAYTRRKEHQKLQTTLQDLYTRLTQDGDPRTEKLLVRLCNIYNKFNQDTTKQRIPSTAGDVVDGFQHMFTVCIEYLNHSHELWEQTAGLHGEAAASIKRQREEIVLEVDKSVTFLEAKLGQLGLLSRIRTQQSLTQMRAELDESMRVAKTAEERIATLEKRPYQEPPQARE